MEPKNATPTPQSYTILRIKRKRNEEPLDALVVESRFRRKKSRGGIGLFKFAQTVEADVWDDEKRAQDIQEQISRLAQESASQPLPPPEASVPAAPVWPTPKDDIRRYTILPHDDDADVERKRVPRPTSPPKVVSAKDLPPKKTLKPDFKMYDAVLTTDKDMPTAVDAEMDKFLPMLNDYLKLHDVSLDPAPDVSIPDVQPDDYVYDVFYHRPVNASEWNEVANFGTLSGLPPSLTDPYDSASESEEEDEADEDSNAEEYYKNDYPEDDDSSDSDEFHEDSEYEDMNNYDEQGDDHDWR